MRFGATRLAAITLVILVCGSRCLGWSHKEHILFTRLAAARLAKDPSASPAMKTWLRDVIGQAPDMAEAEDFFMHAHVGIRPTGFSGLSYWAYVPDERALYDPATQKVAPFGVHEKFLHYIDLELLLSGDVRRQYKHDLSNRPALGDIPRDMTDPRYIQAGMLPFRTEFCYQKLVVSIRSGQLNAPTREAQEGKTAVYWAGYLSHYLADATQPHHATMDYKSQSYFADQRRSPNVHAELEYRMCDDEVNDFMDLRKEYWAIFVTQLEQFHDPVDAKDVWRNSLEVSWRSYEALPLIGLAAMHAAKQAGTPEHPTGPASAFDTEAFFRFHGQCLGQDMSVTEMKAVQTAWAVKRIEKFLRQAWDEAAATSLPR
jgi:hypothetical protein